MNKKFSVNFVSAVNLIQMYFIMSYVFCLYITRTAFDAFKEEDPLPPEFRPFVFLSTINTIAFYAMKLFKKKSAGKYVQKYAERDATSLFAKVIRWAFDTLLFFHDLLRSPQLNMKPIMFGKCFFASIVGYMTYVRNSENYDSPLPAMTYMTISLIEIAQVMNLYVMFEVAKVRPKILFNANGDIEPLTSRTLDQYYKIQVQGQKTKDKMAQWVKKLQMVYEKFVFYERSRNEGKLW